MGFVWIWLEIDSNKIKTKKRILAKRKKKYDYDVLKEKIEKDNPFMVWKKKIRFTQFSNESNRNRIEPKIYITVLLKSSARRKIHYILPSYYVCTWAIHKGERG